MAQSMGEGDVLAYTTAGAVTNGALLIVGATPGVALNSATGSGVVISVAIEGEFVLAKKAAAGTVTQGSKAYYMTTGSTNQATAVAASGKCIGLFTEATTTAATTCKVRLVGGPLLVAL